MNKQEFIINLKEALKSEMKLDMIQEQERYYTSYIDEEVRKGRLEKEVVEELGDPWVIAKNLMGASGEYRSQASVDYRNGEESSKSNQDQNFNGNHVNVWTSQSKFGCLITAIIIIAIISFVLSLVLGFLSFIAPILIPVMVIVFVINYFNKKS